MSTLPVWIKVADRMPEGDEDNLMLWDGAEMRPGTFVAADRAFYDEEGEPFAASQWLKVAAPVE